MEQINKLISKYKISFFKLKVDELKLQYEYPSEDAPALEKELHNHFDQYRVNKVNSRKEFFKVKLSEIKAVVNEKMNKKVQFTKLAEALEYKQSLQVN